MISIIVHLPLRGCPLRYYVSMNIIVNNLQDKWKGSVIPMWRFFRHANWNASTCNWLGQRTTKDGSNNSAHLCLLLIIQFLCRLCNIFFSQINSAEGVLPNDKFRKKIILPFLKYPLKCKFDGQTLIKCDFLEGRLSKYFFQEICSSGGK